jgi:hypothetical protein
MIANATHPETISKTEVLVIWLLARLADREPRSLKLRIAYSYR